MMTTAYTKEEIEKILKEEDFEYHSVPLPYGLCTPGDDRSPTRDLIFPESLAGKTFLDVGSALGYFCFEAERRGASRVVGIELRSNRLRLQRPAYRDEQAGALGLTRNNGDLRCKKNTNCLIR